MMDALSVSSVGSPKYNGLPVTIILRVPPYCCPPVVGGRVGEAGASIADVGGAVVTAAEVVGATVVVAEAGLAGDELGVEEAGAVEGCAELQAKSNKLAIMGKINRIKSLLIIETTLQLIYLAL
jgi:hypothetical protein